MSTGSDVGGMLASEQGGSPSASRAPGLFGEDVVESQEDLGSSQTDPGIQGDVRGQLTLELGTGNEGGEVS